MISRELRRIDGPRGISVAKDAIDVLVRRLSALPISPRVNELRAKAAQHLGELDGPPASALATEGRDQIMRRILELHVDITKLELEAKTSSV
jgi:hypothetical protein